jgi:putative endonuclease
MAGAILLDGADILRYILASETRELYIGVTNDLTRRVAEHRAGLNPDSYSSRHGTSRLV